MTTIMDRRAITMSSLISGVSPKWTAYELKREALDVKRDPKGNFLDLTSKEIKGDTMASVEKLREKSASGEKVACTRTEIFISNFTTPSTVVEYCKKGNETVASPYYCTGLVGVFVDEIHELENLTSKNPVFICKCRKNLYHYKPHVNCDELVISATLIREDFQRIEVVAGSSYVIEAGAVYFWFSLSYSHVIVHKKPNVTNTSISPSVDERATPNPRSLNKRANPSSAPPSFITFTPGSSSPIKASVVSDISNGIMAESKLNYAKKPRLKSCLKNSNVQSTPRPSTSRESSDRGVFVVDDEVHVTCETVDVSCDDDDDSCESSFQRESLETEISIQRSVIDQRNDDIKRLMVKVSKQQQLIERLKKDLDERDKEITKMKKEMCDGENQRKELKRIFHLQYDCMKEMMAILND